MELAGPVQPLCSPWPWSWAWRGRWRGHARGARTAVLDLARPRNRGPANPSAPALTPHQEFDAAFVKVDQSTLFELILVGGGVQRAGTGVGGRRPAAATALPPPSPTPALTPSLLNYPNIPAETLQAANYQNIKPLLDLTCLTVANMIKGKTPEEIRKTFNIPNDFTPAEEEEVRRENQWAFE